MRKFIVKETYEIVTPESAEEGDVAEDGWIDEEGTEYGNAKAIIEHLRDNGVYYRSSYSGYNIFEGEPQVDYSTGESETRHYIVEGVTPKCLNWINSQFKG